MINSSLNRTFFSLKRTVGGVLGGNGSNVLKRVALAHSIANGPVPGLNRDTVESTALDQTNRLGNATPIPAPVSSAPNCREFEYWKLLATTSIIVFI